MDKKIYTYSETYDAQSVFKYAQLGVQNIHWFSEAHTAFTELLPDYDIELFVKIFAATSPLSHLQSNLTIALRTYPLFQDNTPIAEMKLLRSTKVMLTAIRSGTFNASTAHKVARRKVLQFVNAILGDTEAIPIDSWMCRVLGIKREYVWKGKTYYRLPTMQQCNEIEILIKEIARDLNYEPRQLMAAIWAGVRIQEGKFKKTNTRECLLRALSNL